MAGLIVGILMAIFIVCFGNKFRAFIVPLRRVYTIVARNRAAGTYNYGCANE
jgi:hypothetical protein